MAKKFVGVVSMEDDGEVRIQLTSEVGEQMGLTEGRVSLVTAERTIKATPA
jgi:hypothetical protein